MIVDYVALDYLTATSKRDIVREYAQPMFEGNVEATKILGYSGYRGGRSFYGKRVTKGGDVDYMALVSGELAHHCAANIWSSEECLLMNFSRIDIQITVEGWSRQQIFEQYKKWKSGNRRYAELVDSSGPTGGTTIYFGARSSDRRMRVYLKRDEGGKEYTRFEVQYRRKYALNLMMDLHDEYLSSPPEASADDRYRCVQSALSAVMNQELKVMGVQNDQLDRARYILGGGYRKVSIRLETTDNDRKYRWIKSTCYPSIERLMSTSYGVAIVADLVSVFYRNRSMWARDLLSATPDQRQRIRNGGYVDKIDLEPQFCIEDPEQMELFS